MRGLARRFLMLGFEPVLLLVSVVLTCLGIKFGGEGAILHLLQHLFLPYVYLRFLLLLHPDFPSLYHVALHVSILLSIGLRGK